ncbi:MAG: thioredoxin domain-containing protein [Anaplasmataceae bacterium]|nr:thioredoxin domain-containing protein [Anaplasmataceae bacterium]
MGAGELYTNRLIKEKSPYLLQHAHNPVDWYPWGEEAFQKAIHEDKPIFLSIGYATCHWCHVMEHESFGNLQIAQLLNDAFVNIKVDREELPQVDSIYMELAQGLMSSAGGWPLNIVLTPDLKPFFAVTYLPPDAHRGLLGLPQVVQQIKEIWHSKERERLIEQADRIVDIFSHLSPTSGVTLPSELSIEQSIEVLFDIFDPIFGGIKGEPKFPLSYQIEFLLRYAKNHSDSRSLFLAELSLDLMGRGGIYDQLGGGFSRYSVDDRWIVPHFEKMLYDNALLSSAYTEGFRLTHNPRYREITEEIFSYIFNEMTSKEGAFYSAEDADSEGHEGRYYTWTYAEVKMALPSPVAERFCHYYGVTPQGNFEGRSVLHIEAPLEEIAGEFKISPEELRSNLKEWREKLLEKRKERPRPFKDDKILSSWNGLMIHSLARAGEVFSHEPYFDAARKACEAIKTTLWQNGRLLRRYRDGEARFAAGLEDYAFLIKGVLTLFEAGKGSSYLLWAMEMADILQNEFRVEEGAFYQTDGKETLLLRKCELYDGAEPSGNAVHAENLLRLYQITGKEIYLLTAEQIFKAAKTLIDTYPPGTCYHLLGLERYYDKQATTLVIALDEQRTMESEIRSEISKQQLPHLAIIWKPMNDADLEKAAPVVKDKVPQEGRTTIYLCHGNRCDAPLNEANKIMNVLRGFYD